MFGVPCLLVVRRPLILSQTHCTPHQLPPQVGCHADPVRSKTFDSMPMDWHWGGPPPVNPVVKTLDNVEAKSILGDTSDSTFILSSGYWSRYGRCGSDSWTIPGWQLCSGKFITTQACTCTEKVWFQIERDSGVEWQWLVFCRHGSKGQMTTTWRDGSKRILWATTSRFCNFIRRSLSSKERDLLANNYENKTKTRDQGLHKLAAFKTARHMWLSSETNSTFRKS